LEGPFLSVFGILEEKFQIVEFEILKIGEAHVDIMEFDAALPLLAGTHQFYVEFLVPLRGEHKILAHQKGKGLI
jgi:hypothetical protein